METSTADSVSQETVTEDNHKLGDSFVPLTDENGALLPPMPDYSLSGIDYSNHEYDTFIYPGYSFERPVYTYIWGILVIITFLANIIVICVLLRKNMRNPTNLILVGIAISDSLTGLITLPSYWMAYSKFQPAVNYNYYDNANMSSNSTIFPTYPSIPTDMTTTLPNFTYDYSNYSASFQEGYLLSESLCKFFMISKYFLSKTFHTISIWLTLFLGFQRFISVASPFRAQRFFSERNVLITCLVICAFAPILHIYHLVDEKAKKELGMCQWDLDDTCAGGCVYLAVAFALRHFIPCLLLVIFTVLFISQLARSSSRISRIDCNKGNASMHHRDSENRRVSLIVTLIVIVFLIPEIPYGGFLLYVLIGHTTGTNLDLETNRAIHLTYEISLVVSFHANFYIYTFFNKRFRRNLLKVIVYPVISLCGIYRTVALDSRSSLTNGSKRRTQQSDTCTKLEMVNIGRTSSSGGKSTLTMETVKCLNGDSHAENEGVDEKSKCLNAH